MTSLGTRAVLVVLAAIVGLLAPWSIALGADQIALLRQEIKALKEQRKVLFTQIDEQYLLLRAKLKTTRDLAIIEQREARAEKAVATAVLPTKEQQKTAQSNYDALHKALHAKQVISAEEWEQARQYKNTLKRVIDFEVDTKTKILEEQIKQTTALQKAQAQAKKQAAKKK